MKSEDWFDDSSGLDIKIDNDNSKDKLKKHKCDLCVKAFSRYDHLKIHIQRVHEGHKDHECEDCGKKFTSKNGLAYHLKHIHRQPNESENINSEVLHKDLLLGNSYKSVLYGYVDHRLTVH